MQPHPVSSGAAGPRGRITFRIIGNDDEAFLLALYASTREWEFAHTLWSEADKADFLKSQFEAQKRHFTLGHIGAVHRIIQLDGIDIGRLIVSRSDDCLRIIDLAILTQYRGRGIGTGILRSLINEADGGKVPVRLMAQKDSPAVGLYRRHGFRMVADHGPALTLEWRRDWHKPE